MTITIDQIKESSNDSVKYFKDHGVKLNYSIESLKQIDNYFDRHLFKYIPKEGEEIDKETQGTLFSLACYLGETILMNVPGSRWQIDENENALQKIAVILSENNVVWPFDKIAKRFFNGAEDGIYVYGYFLVKDYLEKDTIVIKNQHMKKWWKFW